MLTEEQKLRLRTRAASARVQGKVIETHNPEETAEVVRQFHEEASDRAHDEDVYDRLEEVRIKGAMQRAGIAAAKSAADDAADSFRSGPEKGVDDISWDGFHDEELGGEVKSLVARQNVALVEGFNLPPEATEDQLDAFSENIFSYIGPIPLHVSRYTNRWIKVLGCCVQPLEGDVTDEKTGEVQFKRWNRPLFKLDRVDPETGEHIIVYGGGIRGLQVARHFNGYKQVGDWRKPRMIYIQMETRENSHVMYSFRHRACQEGE